jgi:hypothetical protein
MTDDATLGGAGTFGARSSRPGGAEGHARGRQIEFECVDFCPICRTADVLRATMPPEFQEHWHTWQRELLLAVRSLLDPYSEHVDAERQRATPVEDIPIE